MIIFTCKEKSVRDTGLSIITRTESKQKSIKILYTRVSLKLRDAESLKWLITHVFGS